MIEWTLFLCSLVLFGCYWHLKMQARRQIADLTTQREEAQSRFEKSRRGWREDREQLEELQEIITKTNNRAEGYSEILVAMFDGFRKASDEYEKVRRGRKQ